MFLKVLFHLFYLKFHFQDKRLTKRGTGELSGMVEMFSLDCGNAYMAGCVCQNS